MFAERHPFARIRAQIIEANPELQERELIKLQSLAAAIKGALVERGVSANAAILAAQAGVTVFHVAFAHWVQQNDPTAFRRLMDESLEELRSVTAAGVSSGSSDRRELRCDRDGSCHVRGRCGAGASLCTVGTHLGTALAAAKSETARPPKLVAARTATTVQTVAVEAMRCTSPSTARRMNSPAASVPHAR